VLGLIAIAADCFQLPRLFDRGDCGRAGTRGTARQPRSRPALAGRLADAEAAGGAGIALNANGAEGTATSATFFGMAGAMTRHSRASNRRSDLAAVRRCVVEHGLGAVVERAGAPVGGRARQAITCDPRHANAYNNLVWR